MAYHGELSVSKALRAIAKDQTGKPPSAKLITHISAHIISRIVHEACVSAGLNIAQDYDGIETWDDVHLYWERIKELLKEGRNAKGKT